MSEKMDEHTATSFAKGMQEKIKSGKASDCNEAEKIQNNELIMKLELVKRYLEKKDGDWPSGELIDRAGFYLRGIAENDLAKKIYLEISPKIFIEKVSDMLTLLQKEEAPNEDVFDKCLSRVCHDLQKYHWFEGRRDTHFYKIATVYVLDIYVALGDYRFINILETMGETEKFREMRERSASSNTEYNFVKVRKKVIEISNKFLEDIKDFEENNVDLNKALAEVKKEIDDKLSQIKQEK